MSRQRLVLDYELTDIGVIALRNAVMKQAAEQHRKCLGIKLRQRSKHDADPENDAQIYTLERFLLSEWGQLLSGGLGDHIIERDYKIVRDEIRGELKQ